jgi:hypothetical protein
VCAALLFTACKSYDAALLDDSTLDERQHGGAGASALDGGPRDDAGEAGSGGRTGSGGSGPSAAADGGALSGCVENAGSDTCPIVCPETCNNEDDDCDGTIDEDASAACELPNAVTACSGGKCLIASCKGGFRNCDDDAKNGCEAPADDVNNCGTCGHRCELLHADVACKKDKCVEVGCKSGFDDCDDDESGCETSATTLTNCAACGLSCTEGDVANAKPTCERGFCGVGECFMGYGDCNKAPGDGCEEPLASLEHCGACGETCDLAGSEDDCSAGVCLAGACSDGYDDCDGNKANGCESLSADANCGGCGKTCDGSLANVDGASCDEEKCKLDCKRDFGDCDEDPGTGCETPVTTRDRCGDCDTPCSIKNAIATCGTGECTFVRCLPGFGDCNDDVSPDDGCETPLDTLANCGACDKKCDKASCGGGVCTAADCSQPPHDDDCGGARCGNCDGDDADCEANLNTSKDDCGACDNACDFAAGVAEPRAALSCSAGSCVASCTTSGYGNCDGDYRNGCERALNTLSNCGACGTGCAIANATPTCDTGACRVSQCAADWADCNNDHTSCETQLGTTINCTGCGGACDLPNAVPSCAGGAGNHSCAIASCTQSYYADCDGTAQNGCEIDKRSSAANCGTCGNDCRAHAHVAGATCGSGTCNYTCASGWGNCTSASGCETPLTTATDCGACGLACARANGSASCSTGTCQLTGCDDGYDNCDGNAQNGCEPLTSLADCGACGEACSVINGTGTCATRACAVASCNAGWADCNGVLDDGCERNVDPPAQGGLGPCLPDASCTRRTYNNRDYYVCTGERTFSDARAHCQLQLLGDLVHVDDASENAFVQSAIGGNDAWIGGSDGAAEGTWRWQNNNGVFWTGGAGGSATGYANWNGGEPNNANNNEDCAMFYASGNAAGKWNDTPCSDLRDYVCEVQPDLCPDDPQKANPGQCGCGVADTDTDDDGTANCNDLCPNDGDKVEPKQCGCGNPETNSDTDPVADCLDQCPTNGGKTEPGQCGCGAADTNSDTDSVADCNDACPFDGSRTTAPCGYTYTPTNFDQTKLDFGDAPTTVLDCQATTTINTGNGNATTDTSMPTITNWCGAAPAAFVGQQTGGPNVVVIPLQGLTVAAGRTLRVIGNRPVILAVRGDVSIGGTISAKGIGSTAGAGGNASCSGGTGKNGGNNGSTNAGAGGGGGGGFGLGGNGGGRGHRLLGDTAGGAAGGTEGNGNLSPLRGGCSGGKGGNGNGTGGAGGGGGGAIQISASGTLTILQGGVVTASGGGGLAANDEEDGGGGGGSGGSVLLEGGAVIVSSGAWITANGGGGASGASTSNDSSAPGTDGFSNNTQRAPGGPGSSGGGNGGGGGATQGGAQAGADGDSAGILPGGGGGGGGGGVGRIRVHGASSCSLTGTFSPASANNSCPP